MDWAGFYGEIRMKRLLFVAAIAAILAPPAWADGCADNPKASLKQAEEALRTQRAKLSKKDVKKVSQAIKMAKKADKSDKKAEACKNLGQANAILGIKG